MLEVKNVSASYGSFKALIDVSLSLADGEILGVVGPNGAGKTTLFRVLARVADGYEGTVTLDGQPLANLAGSEIGYLPEAPFQFDFFTPVEMLLFERTLRLPQLSEEEVLRTLHDFGMQSYLHKPIKRLSAGLKKRVALAAAFLGEPRLLILDEPLNTIDVQTVIVLKRMIQQAKARGAIILVSSHVLEFFDGMIGRIVFLDQGAVHHSSTNDPRKAEELYTELFLSN